jgi:hypothetical protein
VTLVLTAQMRLDAAQTKGELEATKRGIQGVTAATAEQANKSRAAAGAADAEAAAKRRNAQASRELTTANRGAAGATGNLVAQFNDIGMMLAAGQNPLQLAIQQGSQITQVIGPMGAAGAARALGSAFVGMLNPLSLATLGVIALGGYLVQSMTSAEAKVDQVSESLQAIVEATAKTQTEIDKLRFGVDEDYQVELLSEQLRLRDQYNLKVAELNGYLSTTTDSIDRQRVSTAELVAEIQGIVDRNAEINGLLADQQNRSAQLAILEGIKAQRAGEMAAKQQEAARAAEALQAKIAAVVANLNSADGSRLVSAFQAAFPIASQLLGMAQNIVATIGAAGAFQSAETGELAAQYAQYGSGRVIGERLAKESGSLYGGKRVIPLAAGAGGGGGAAAARDEADALQELITSLEAEIAALRESDPVQKELLQHRKAMEGATEAERLKVEELIATREREKAAMEAIQELQQFKEDLVEGALDSLIAKGQSLKEVLDQVIIALMKAIIQAAIFGSGPLGSMFGGGGIGALIFGGGKAEGGMVHGPGTGTSDSVLTPLSNGEYVVNARATAQNRHLLEAINSGGRIPGFAQGGYVGTDNRRMAARGEGGGDTHIHMHLAGAKGDREIEMLARKGTEAALKDYDRNAAPATVRRVSSDPRRTG